jgi:protein-S-isoprenylcysteine O-methyltransferase Ste14
MTDARGRGPGVVFPPPLIFVAGFLVGWLLDARIGPLWPSIIPASRNIIDLIGGLFVGIGVGLALSGIRTFRRAETSVIPNHDASQLVIAGPYRYTRNPMYVGLTVVYVGAALVFSLLWSLVMLPFVLWIPYQYVIRREERYLSAAFGDQYRQYQHDVRRWL